MEKNLVELVGVYIKTITKIANGWTLICVRPTSDSTVPSTAGQTIKVKGMDLLEERIVVKFYGEWEKDHKNQWTFNAKNYEILPPSSVNAIINYLSSAPFKGVGAQTAKAVANYFGEDTIKIIENSPERLMEVPNMTTEKMFIIVNTHKNSKSFGELTAYCTKLNLSKNQILKIYNKYQEKSLEKIKKNPYTLFEVRGFTFEICDQIALNENVQLDSYQRIVGCFDFILKKNEQDGNTYMEKAELKQKAMEMLNRKKQCVSEERYDEVFFQAKKNLDVVVRSNRAVLRRDTDFGEYEIAEKILAMLNYSIDDTFKFFYKLKVDNYNSANGTTLSQKQLEAVYKSLTNRISIITGGPGTGKTTIMKALISIYEEQNPSAPITILAPTGIAARRIAKVVGKNATTIHSALQIYDDEESNINELEAGLVVVDEMSMVDSFLMSKLINAIQPDSTVVLVGDIDQLPSVGAGKILGDLISSEYVPVSRLTEVFRQKNGSTIVDNARKINNGDTNLTFDDSFQLIEASDQDDAVEKLINLYSQVINEKGISNVALLCPLRNERDGLFKVSSDYLNKKIRDLINPIQVGKQSIIINGKEFRVGDRVMQWKNNKIASNGDIGELVRIDTSGDAKFTILFENGNVANYSKSEMADIDFAYSYSIHKSQGSEYDTVIIPMLSCQRTKIHRRNLLYTGVTRAKKRVIILGDKEMVDYCIKTSDTTKRLTLLMHRIKYNAPRILKGEN